MKFTSTSTHSKGVEGSMNDGEMDRWMDTLTLDSGMDLKMDDKTVEGVSFVAYMYIDTVRTLATDGLDLLT